MQEKSNIVAEHSARLGLNIHRGKSKILKVNSTSTVSVTLGVEAIEVDHFTYLGSVVDTQGGTDADVKSQDRQGKGDLCSIEEYLQFQRSFTEKQEQDFQYNGQGCSSLRS